MDRAQMAALSVLLLCPARILPRKLGGAFA